MKKSVFLLVCMLATNLYGAAQPESKGSTSGPLIAALCSQAIAKGADPAAVQDCLTRLIEPATVKSAALPVAQPALADSPEFKLLCATRAGKLEMVNEILQEGSVSNINAGVSGVKVSMMTLCQHQLSAYMSMTPLMIAITFAQKEADPCNNNYYHIAHALLNAGADAFGVRTRASNETAYDMAKAPCLRELIENYMPAR